MSKLATLVDGPELDRGVETLSRLADELHARSGYVTGHAPTVARHTAAIAQRFGIDGPNLAVLEVGAALHDLGKLCVRSSVLAKPGPLTDQEWDVMRLHPVAGARVLSALVPLPELAAIVHWHHERWDGSGYPDGLSGEAIPLGARIVAVADAYQAMVERRPYRAPRSEASARACVLACAGRDFDPACVEAFDESMSA